KSMRSLRGFVDTPSIDCYSQSFSMHHGAASRWARRTCAALALMIGVWPLQMRPPAASFTTWVPPSGGSPEEVRALWVLRTSLTTPASIEGLVRTAHDHGFNTLLVQVRGRGDAY